MHASVIRVRICGKRKKSLRYSDTKTEVIIAEIDVDFDVLDFISRRMGSGKIHRGRIIKARIGSIVVTFIAHAFSRNLSGGTDIEFKSNTP